MHRRLSIAACLAIVVLSGCSLLGAGGSPGATVIPVGSGGSMTAGQLRVALVEQFGPRWWCDPDFYPLARADEQAIALQRFAAMQAEGDVFGAVVAQLRLTGTTSFAEPLASLQPASSSLLVARTSFTEPGCLLFSASIT